MDESLKDQVAGKFHEAKGAVKEKTGEILKDPNLKAEGEDESLSGTVQKKVGQVEKVFEK